MGEEPRDVYREVLDANDPTRKRADNTLADMLRLRKELDPDAPDMIVFNQPTDIVKEAVAGEAISRAAAIQALQDARERGTFDLRGLIAEMKGLPAFRPVAVWSDEVPTKADAGDAYYFVRRKDKLDVVVMGFSMGKGWLNGVSYERSDLSNHLFLGPLTPDRFTDEPSA